PPFLMALMVGNGAQAGALSPFAPTGVIVNGIMDRIGLPGYELQTYANNLLAHVVVTFAAYLLFGGVKLFTRRPVERLVSQSDQAGARGDAELVETEPFAWIHWVTLGILATLVIVVVFFNMQVGMAALTGAAFLALLRPGDEKEALKRMPWGVVILVCGVTVLIGVLEKTQGMSLFADLLAKISTPGTVTLTIAFVTGVVSAYSSTSGVVLPAFLPTVPALATQLGADPMAIASAMNVGGHLVDLSPLSTIGALCIAALPPEADPKKLFNQLLAWGLSMTVVGAVICWILF
ncbi:MAG: SLC13 family permease, partial [Acidobacteriota bacterium]|nr:SLC13 family permease [Acidobacteriota bacterium]